MTLTSNSSGAELMLARPNAVTASGCPSSRHDINWSEVALYDWLAYETSNSDCVDGPWTAQDSDHNRGFALATTRSLLDADGQAAHMVAACVSTVQSSNETRPAFVKRIVRAWLDEMGRVE